MLGQKGIIIVSRQHHILPQNLADKALISQNCVFNYQITCGGRLVENAFANLAVDSGCHNVKYSSSLMLL